NTYVHHCYLHSFPTRRSSDLVGRECAGVVLAIEAGGMFLSLATGFSTTTMGAEELMPFSLPRVAFTGVSLDNPAPGAVPFIRVPLICVGAFVPGVCVAVDTGVVTPPAQEETEIFLGWCIPGSHPLYHAVPSNAARMLLRIASRSIPARNPGVNSPRARKDRLDGGSDLRKTRVGLGAGFRSGGGTQVGSISASCGKACEPRLIA